MTLELLPVIMLALALVLSQFIETMLGFGGTVIGLALGLFFFPLDILLPTLVTVGLLQSAWLILRWHQHIQWRLLLISILPLAAAGMLIGIAARGIANETVLIVLLCLFIIAVSTLELASIFHSKSIRGPLPRPLSWLTIIGGGIFHGLFAAGGPLIVYYSGREIEEPAEFRSTLSVLWLILGAILLTSFWINHQANVSSLQLAAMILPGFIIGVFLGSRIKLEAKSFKAITWIVLLIIGMIQFTRTLFIS